jgi:hypothetical protein
MKLRLRVVSSIYDRRLHHCDTGPPIKKTPEIAYRLVPRAPYNWMPKKKKPITNLARHKRQPSALPQGGSPADSAEIILGATSGNPFLIPCGWVRAKLPFLFIPSLYRRYIDPLTTTRVSSPFLQSSAAYAFKRWPRCRFPLTTTNGRLPYSGNGLDEVFISPICHLATFQYRPESRPRPAY